MSKYSPRQVLCLLLEAVVFVSALWGVSLTMISSSHTFMGGANSLKYFTIQSNIALAIVSLAAFIRNSKRKTAGRIFRTIRLMGAISITLTGAVFCFVLAPTMGAKAWNLTNILTHVVVPVGAVADFFLSKDGRGLRYRDTIFTLLPPLVYVLWAGVCYLTGVEFAPGQHYPYFFLNWDSSAGAFGFSSELPFMGCMWWILLLLLLLICAACLYVALSNRQRNPQKLSQNHFIRLN